MSLKAFHLAFISASILLAFFFAAWCLGLGEHEGRGFRLAGFASVAAGLGLAAYETWFVRKALPRAGQSPSGGERERP
jgi:hypothetical protein